MTKKQRYSPELKAEAVKLVLEQGMTQEQAAERLALPKGTLGNWLVAAKSGGVTVAPGARSVLELENEIMRLRRALAETTVERDILKKATALFAREALPGTRS